MEENMEVKNRSLNIPILDIRLIGKGRTHQQIVLRQLTINSNNNKLSFYTYVTCIHTYTLKTHGLRCWQTIERCKRQILEVNVDIY